MKERTVLSVGKHSSSPAQQLVKADPPMGNPVGSLEIPKLGSFRWSHSDVDSIHGPLCPLCSPLQDRSSFSGVPMRELLNGFEKGKDAVKAAKGDKVVLLHVAPRTWLMTRTC